MAGAGTERTVARHRLCASCVERLRRLTLELCSAAGARQIVLAQAGGDHDTSSFDHAGVPHCVYCPGFAANVALGSSLPALPGFVRTFAYRAAAPAIPDFPRKGIRLAQPRAPPENTPI